MRLNFRWHERGVVELPEGLDRTLRLAARAILLVVVVLFAVQASRGGIPSDPEGGPFTDDIWGPVQVGFLALTAVGLAVSFWSMAVASALVALGGGGMGVLSTVEYEPPFGFFVLLVFLVPAIMMWLEWQHRETMPKIAALAIGTAVLLVGSWTAGGEVYAHFNGPFHPESETEALEDSPVQWLWSGAVDSGGFSVTARLRDEADLVRLVVTEEASGVEVARSGPAAVDDADEPVTMRVDGLEPATGYVYAVEIDGVVDDVTTGSLSTFPDGAASVRIAVASCARTGSNGAVFDAIREVDADLYVVTGDLHYRNIADNSVSQFRSAYDQIHDQPSQAALYRSVPIAYVWDDHDFGPNNADSSASSRPAAWASYRSHVPHYDLVSPASGPVNQAFTMGRIRVVITDTRSMRDPDRGVLLGDDQLAWLLEELLAARDSHALTVWVTSTPWIGAAVAGSDTWAGFSDERERIGGFLAEHEIANLVMLAGDAHMVAIDDGTNSGYGGHGGFPILQAAALDRPGSVKGGPYSHGTFPGPGQFGVVDVVDGGGAAVQVTLRGLDHTGAELVSLSFEVEVPGADER